MYNKDTKCDGCEAIISETATEEPFVLNASPDFSAFGETNETSWVVCQLCRGRIEDWFDESADRKTEAEIVREVAREVKEEDESGLSDFL